MARPPAPARRVTTATIALVLAGLVALVAIMIAITRGSGSPELAPPGAAAPAPKTQEEEVAAFHTRIAELRRELERDPDNHERWFQLGLLHRTSGASGEAEAAFRRAMQLEPGNADYVTHLGEAVLMNQSSADRRDEAEQLFKRALELAPKNPMTRFYAATMKDQRGRHAEAVDDLIALLKDAPAGAGWTGNVRRSIENVARLRSIDIAGRLPPESAATAAIPGPTQQQLDAARSIPPSQQDDMAKQMVERLATRLQQEPRNEQGWMMLMRSRMVLRDQNGARAALQSALQAFSDDAAAQQRLRQAAGQLGVPPG